MSALYRVDFAASNNEGLYQDFTLTDAACQPVDLTDTNLHMALKPNFTLPEGALEQLLVTTENSKILITDAENGRFSLAVPASDMAQLTPGVWEHDLLIVPADAKVKRLWFGSLKITSGVTPVTLPT